MYVRAIFIAFSVDCRSRNTNKINVNKKPRLAAENENVPKNKCVQACYLLLVLVIFVNETRQIATFSSCTIFTETHVTTCSAVDVALCRWFCASSLGPISLLIIVDRLQNSHALRVHGVGWRLSTKSQRLTIFLNVMYGSSNFHRALSLYELPPDTK